MSYYNNSHNAVLIKILHITPYYQYVSFCTSLLSFKDFPQGRLRG